VDVEGVQVQVRASIGVALAPSHGTDPTLLLRHADQAMYQAKGDGGGTHVHFDAPQTIIGDSAAESPLELLAQLRGESWTARSPSSAAADRPQSAA
jgi:predicted signal transduction protein with EAL and GGDEF domain